MRYPRAFEELIDALKKLPGIGLKSAERIAYKILEMDEEEIKAFAASLINAKKNYIAVLSVTDYGSKCLDVCLMNGQSRNSLCCSNPKDAFAIEKPRL